MMETFVVKSGTMESNLWWGYKHINGNYQAKVYYDQRDIEEAERSPFCAVVTGPFEASNREEALITVISNIYNS